MTAPNSELCERILAIVGYDEKQPTTVVTPGVSRSFTDPEYEFLAEEPASFRSAVGALLHYASDIEPIGFAVKELSKVMHAPTLASWHDLTRLCRYLFVKT